MCIFEIFLKILFFLMNSAFIFFYYWIYYSVGINSDISWKYLFRGIKISKNDDPNNLQTFSGVENED